LLVSFSCAFGSQPSTSDLLKKVTPSQMNSPKPRGKRVAGLISLKGIKERIRVETVSKNGNDTVTASYTTVVAPFKSKRFVVTPPGSVSLTDAIKRFILIDTFEGTLVDITCWQQLGVERFDQSAESKVTQTASCRRRRTSSSALQRQLS
jgi:hypothetical protein